MNRTLRYIILIPLSVVAFYLLFVQSSDYFGLSVSLVILAGAWLVWYLLWATLRDSAAAEEDEAIVTISPGEQRAWVGLLFSMGILVYFALHSAQMVAADGSMAPEASVIGRHIVMLIVFWQIVMYVLRKHWRDQVEHDERDRVIQAHANSWARVGLSVFVIGVAVTLGLSPLDHLAWAKPMVISNLLIAGLIGSSLLEYAVTGISYWRDRH